MSHAREKRWRPYRYENGNWVEIVDLNYDVNRDGVIDPDDIVLLKILSFLGMLILMRMLTSILMERRM